MKKKNYLTILIVSLALLGLVSTPVMASSADAGKISISGHTEFGLVVEETDTESKSDMGITFLELAFNAKVSELVKVHAVLYYERPLFHESHGPLWEEGYVTIGDAEKHIAAGLMFVPFGVQQTHFPGDPAIAAPLTLLGETLKEAVAVSGELLTGLTATVYGFRGHWDTEYADYPDDKEIDDANTKCYGIDVNYKMEEQLTVGASYISNVCETDTMIEALRLPLVDGGAFELPALTDDYAGAALYLHLGIADLFFEAEYMTALDKIADAGDIEPSVMNIEAGINLDAAGKNLEVVVKYASSDDAAALHLPETRYGIAANLELFEHTTLSLAYLTDEYYNEDTADTMVALVGVEF